MNLKKLHDPGNGELRAAGFMSGSGTNLRRVLEHESKLRKEQGYSPYRVVVIFSDNCVSQAQEIGKDFNIPVVMRDIKAFYRARGIPKRDMSLRPEFDRETVKALKSFDAALTVYGGYMSIASNILIDAFLGVNVHPADLSVKTDGRRRWVGDHAVRDAVSAGEKTISSTTHLVEPVVDGGRILMISAPINVEIPPGLSISRPDDLKEIESVNQERLKKAGDWVIMPMTIQYIAEGRYAADKDGNLYFDGKPVPDGVRVGD
jgi:folate-dependent phosphoribosylglycinamide formyltransferase PurN